MSLLDGIDDKSPGGESRAMPGELQRWAVGAEGRLHGWLERLDAAPPVSVVVPVHNGYDCVRRLLGTAGIWDEVAEVVIVDDMSTDGRIAGILSTVTEKIPQAKVVRNPRNLGFVGAVNRGVSFCETGNDVIILNSDAVPSMDWIQGLRIAAYSEASVATVSPLSNSAGFFSVPISNAHNELLPGFSSASSTRLLRWLAPSLTEDALATCGFCWYVRRQALSRLGLLDSMLFHRGYAEETDFCLRALETGFKNVVALTVFVEHLGSQSFTSEKSRLKRRNAAILKACVPDFIDRLKAYEASSVIPAIGGRFARLAEAVGATNAPALQNWTIDVQSGTGSSFSAGDGAYQVALMAGADFRFQLHERVGLKAFCLLLLRFLPSCVVVPTAVAESPSFKRTVRVLGLGISPSSSEAGVNATISFARPGNRQ